MSIMASTSFTFLQVLLAAGAISCQASTDVLPATTAVTGAFGSFFTDFSLDEAMWEGLKEAGLVLVVFFLASACVGSYRRRTAKSLRAEKAQLLTSCNPSPVPKQTAAAPWRRPSALGAGAAVPAGSLSKTGRHLIVPKALGSAAKSPSKPSEADLIANAVRAGKASELPRLLDAAIARSVAAAVNCPSTLEQEVATALLHSALRACAAARCFNEGIATYEHLSGRIGTGSCGVWSVLLYINAEAGGTQNFHHGKQIFANLCEQASPSGNDFVNMVRCYAGQGDSRGLREALATMRSSCHMIDVYSWNRALAACSNSQGVLEFAETLAAAGICAEGLDAVGYNTLMKYNARAGRLSRCLELRSLMLTKGLTPSEVTFGTLLEASVAAGDLVSARKVFDDLSSSGLRLNVVHCTTFIKGLVGANKLDEAAGVLEEMACSSSGVKPDLITYSTIVKAYAERGDIPAAVKTLQQMMDAGVKPDEIIYNCVLTGCATFPHKPSSVMQMFETLLKLGLKPTTTTLSILLKSLSHSEAWSMSLQVLQDAPKNFGLEPETRLFAQLAQTCVKSRLGGKMVLEVFHAMLENAGRRRERVDAAMVGRFLRSCLLAHEVQLAVELRDVAERAGISVDAQVAKMLKTACAKKARS